MGCYHPLRAWRSQDGNISLAREPTDSYTLRLPCGGCLGCRTARAKEWMLRCHLELQQHQAATFTTLTYDERYLPPTLDKRHLQLFIKRLRFHRRTAGALRFFASGEYGEQNGRPHFHALLYGLPESEAALVQDTWQKGFTKTVAITPAAIAYVAGYAAKKIGYKREVGTERVDPETGEVYTWQPPFIQMSRRPGIGGHARRWPQSWRLYAVHNGTRMPVPRFLHEAWKAQASREEQEILMEEKQRLNTLRDTSKRELEAAEANAIARQKIQAAKRKL